MRGRPAIAALGFASLVAAAGCSDEAVNPVATALTSSPAVVDGGGFEASPPPVDVDAGPLRRSVEVRNPLGGPVGNLLADGDFELSTIGDNQSAQVAWREFVSDGSAEAGLKTETGGLCRTGLRCGVLRDHRILFGRGAAASGGAGNDASVWVKPPPGQGCKAANALLVGCDTFATFKLLQPDKEPDAEGWCSYHAHLGPQDSSICLYIQSKVDAETTGLIDSAVLLPDDGTANKSKDLGEAWVPPAEVVQSLEAIQDRIRRGMRF